MEVQRRRLRSSDLEKIDCRMIVLKIERVNRDGLSEVDTQKDMRMDQASASKKIATLPPPPMVIRRPENGASAAKAPTKAALEEFFTEAEEYIRKRFAEKYNYDIVKDAPMLEGRYQWVHTHTSI